MENIKTEPFGSVFCIFHLAGAAGLEPAITGLESVVIPFN